MTDHEGFGKGWLARHELATGENALHAELRAVEQDPVQTWSVSIASVDSLQEIDVRFGTDCALIGAQRNGESSSYIRVVPAPLAALHVMAMADVHQPDWENPRSLQVLLAGDVATAFMLGDRMRPRTLDAEQTVELLRDSCVLRFFVGEIEQPVGTFLTHPNHGLYTILSDPDDETWCGVGMNRYEYWAFICALPITGFVNG